MVALAELIAARPAEEPAPGFTATVQGFTCEVTAVLERTVVLLAGGERVLVNQRVALVDPEELTWRQRRPAGACWRADSAETGRRRSLAGKPLAAPDVAARCSCGASLASGNRHGQCRTCQETCPTCRRPKARGAEACQGCRSARRRQEAAS